MPPLPVRIERDRSREPVNVSSGWMLTLTRRHCQEISPVAAWAYVAAENLKFETRCDRAGAPAPT